MYLITRKTEFQYKIGVVVERIQWKSLHSQQTDRFEFLIPINDHISRVGQCHVLKLFTNKIK